MKNRINTLANKLINKLRADITVYEQHITHGSYSAVRVSHFEREIMYRQWLLVQANKVELATLPCLTELFDKHGKSGSSLGLAPMSEECEKEFLDF